MGYNPNIPQATDIPAQSQPQILANFQQINSQFSVDHVALDAGALNGYHKQVDFSAYQAPATPVDPQSVLYTKIVNSHPGLFYLNSQTASQYTAASNGSAVLMGGVIIKWGSAVISGSGGSFSFVSAFPNHCYQLFLTTGSTGFFVATSAFSTTGGTIGKSPSAGNVSVNYFAIGD